MRKLGTIEKPTNIIRILIGTFVYSMEEEKNKNSLSYLENISNINEYIRNYSQTCSNKNYELNDSIHKVAKENMNVTVSSDSTLEEKLNNKIEFSKIFDSENFPNEYGNIETSKNLNKISEAKPYLNVSLFKKIEKNGSVKRARLLKNVLYLYFQTITDAIIFYVENKDNHIISFENEYAFDREKNNQRYFEEMLDVEINKKIFPQQTIIKQKKLKIIESINSGVVSLNSNANYMKNEVFNEFNDRIVFFSTIFKKLGEEDLKIIEDSFKQGNFLCILNHAKELCVGAQSNIFMQEVLKSITEENLKCLIYELEYDIGPISATKYGAYVIQCILNLVKTPEVKKLVLHYFKKYAPLLITHPLGNYSIQTLKKFDSSFFASIFIDHLESVIQTNIGMKVFKKSLDLFADYTVEINKAIDQCEEPHRSDLKRIFSKQDTDETNTRNLF
ncbi:hypothetical protein H312_01671 [Anncaliia algerae PRA339]|uniref:PUM-HD domain-containing protein n=1 Tax=Anncaliia algerae PRA339 TaxID=1288291 RepID=A0A059F0R5_9MICR|nr:hypothetical protein H312_01671 [Anncaliia algerae PRA339]